MTRAKWHKVAMGLRIGALIHIGLSIRALTTGSLDGAAWNLLAFVFVVIVAEYVDQ